MTKPFTLLALCVLAQSCHTWQTITVNGTPGTEIYTPDMQNLGTIAGNGEAKVRVSRNEYYAYLQYHEAGTEKYVPFALNYYYKSYAGTKAINYLGWGICAGGLSLLTTGTIMAITAEEEYDDDLSSMGGIFAGIGGSATLVGAALAGVTQARTEETQRRHKFKYASVQNTNQDIRLTDFTDCGYAKNLSGETEEPSYTAVKESKQNTATPQSRKTRQTQLRETLSDAAKVVADTYTATGKLLFEDELIESYTSLKASLKYAGKNKITLTVYDGQGNEYFDQSFDCTVKKAGTSGKYILLCDGTPIGTVHIEGKTKSAKLSTPMKVNGDRYTLEITAKKNSTYQRSR